MFTVDILESKKACLSQIKLFKEHFPNGSPTTIESALSVASIFDWDWAAHRLLSANGLKTYKDQRASLWKTYEEQRAPFYKTYEEQRAPFYKTYEEQIAPLYKTYEEQIAPLDKTYEEQTASLWKTYEDQVASLFASIYISEQ
jgi:cyclopropane fatty-acyl-phospholipid synthase-like methyltransferase